MDISNITLFIKDSFLLYGTCSSTDCVMAQMPFSNRDYTRCPVCNEPSNLPDSLSPVINNRTNCKNVFEKYFPEFIFELFKEVKDSSEQIGNTSIRKNSNISKWLDIEDLYLKDEGENPSGSFKDRGSIMAIALLEEYVKRAKMERDFIVGTVSTGNMAISTAFFTNKTDHNSFVVVSSKTPLKKIKAIQRAAGKNNMKIFVVDGEYSDIHEIIYRVCSKLRRKNISIFPQLTDDIFRISGYATLFAEIIDQLKRIVPDFIVLPIGSGALFRSGVWAIEKIFLKGFIKKIPRVVLVQEEGGNPIMNAYKKNLQTVEKISMTNCVADAIALSNSRSGNPVLEILRKGYHLGISINSNEILEAQNILYKNGFFPEEASSASVAAVKKLKAKGIISNTSSVVCVLTGREISKRDLHDGLHNSQIIRCSLDNLEENFFQEYKSNDKKNQYLNYFA